MRSGFILIDGPQTGGALEAASSLGQPEQCTIVYRGQPNTTLPGEYVDSGSLRLVRELSYKVIIDQRSSLTQADRERQLRDGLRVVMDGCRHSRATIEALVFHDSGLQSQALVQGAALD